MEEKRYRKTVVVFLCLILLVQILVAGMIATQFVYCWNMNVEFTSDEKLDA